MITGAKIASAIHTSARKKKSVTTVQYSQAATIQSLLDVKAISVVGKQL